MVPNGAVPEDRTRRKSFSINDQCPDLLLTSERRGGASSKSLQEILQSKLVSSCAETAHKLLHVLSCFANHLNVSCLSPPIQPVFENRRPHTSF